MTQGVKSIIIFSLFTWATYQPSLATMQIGCCALSISAAIRNSKINVPVFSPLVHILRGLSAFAAESLKRALFFFYAVIPN